MSALPITPLGGATPLPQPKAGNAEAALRLAGAGLHIFPCDASDDKDRKKRPLGGIKWRDESSNDSEKVAAWWRRWPSALIGLDVGKARLVVIDADRHPGAPDGVAALQRVVGGPMMALACPVIETAGNGRHLIFAQPDGETFGNSSGALPKGVDVRGDGGYVIAPGSTRLDGARWATKPGTADLATAFQAGTIPVLPEKIAALIRQHPERASAPATEVTQAVLLPKVGDVGTRERAFAAKALAENAAELSSCGKGERNTKLNSVTYRMATMVASGWIAEAEIRAAFQSASQANGYAADKGWPAFNATYVSAMKGGIQKPHPPLEDRPYANDDAKFRALGDEAARLLIAKDNGTIYDRDTGEVIHDAPNEPSKGSKASFEPFEPFKWSEPKPINAELLPVPPFDPAFLPTALSGWAADISERMQIPLDFVGVSLLVALGSIIGRKVAIRPQRHTDWTEVANLWGMVVGRPGALKSPAMAEALKPLNKLEAEARKENEEALIEYKRAEKLHELQSKQAERKAATSKDEITADMLAGEAPEPPRMRRYILNDCTYEALGVALAHNPNGVLAFRDELISLLKSLDDERNVSARGFYLQAWNGTSGYTFDRIIRGQTHIDAVCVSLLGATQPGRLAEYVQRAQGAGDDGMIQRFGLLVWPDQSPAFRNVDRWPDTNARQSALKAFTHLNDLEPQSIGAQSDDFDSLPFLRFSDAAQLVFDCWRHTLEGRLRGGELSPMLESHLSKYRKLVPSLALVCHLSDGGRGPVSETALVRALAIADYAEAHARRCYASGDQGDAAAAHAILARIRKGDLADNFTARDVHQSKWAKLTDREIVQRGLDMLVGADWIQETSVGTGGRPSVKYAINPRGRK
jgi:putative DNA primase/helicase